MYARPPPNLPLMTGTHLHYTAAMPRFAPSQPDLFVPTATPAPEPPPPTRSPLDELADLLAELRAADRLPWPNLTVAAAVEQRYLGLARIAGAEGQKLAAAIMDEAERLFAADEREAANRYAPAASLLD
jgi:hypothetical protein